jgi:TolB-like protein/Flp pilus assembly protein TadD
MDLVGYSLLLITEQTRVMKELTDVVKNTAEFRRADAQGKLVRIPTGDGMSLVFFDNPQAPIECATKIASALQGRSDIKLRMGIHSGPVNEVIDVSGRLNVTGAGIDLAQRTMDCGDSGHILLSRHVAEDLAPFPRWHTHLHDLGEYEVKHGRRLGLVNFYMDKIGNADLPRKCHDQRPTSTLTNTPSTSVASRFPRSKHALVGAAALLIIVVALGTLLLIRPNLFELSTKPGATHDRPSIAVLPFENANNDSNTEYLSEGISEALINSLTELQQLKVIARTTAFHYKSKDVDPRQVGRELHVATVLTGRVRQMQDALSVQVDLVDATTGAQLWGTAFDRPISDVVAVKQAIAREVTQKLKLRLSGAEERRLVKRDTTDAEAYQSYLRGRYFWNKRTPSAIRQAIAEFEHAIDRDPGFALGYAGLADSYILLQQYVGVPSSETIPKARAAAARALQIDDSLAESHTSAAAVHQFAREWNEAEQEFRRAIALNDNYATAHHWFCTYLLIRGRWDDALRQITRAEELDPLSPIISANFVIIFLAKNDIKAAFEQCENIIALDANHPAGHDWLGWVYFKQGRMQEAIKEREKIVDLAQRAPPQLGSLGYVYGVAGRRDDAVKIFHELEEQYSQGKAIGQYLAMVLDGLGERDQAFAWLEKDFQQHSGELQFITWRVQFEQLRRDSRYADLMRRMGLSP